MKTEEHAWRALREHASRQLPADFADRIVQAAWGPAPETWRQFQAHAAAQIRPGFAGRVLRAVRDFPANVPSLSGQFALGAMTVAVCLAAVVTFHMRSTRVEEQIALAGWQHLAMETQDFAHGR